MVLCGHCPYPAPLFNHERNMSNAILNDDHNDDTHHLLRDSAAVQVGAVHVDEARHINTHDSSF